MAKMPSLLDLAEQDRRRSELAAMRAFTTGMIAPSGRGSRDALTLPPPRQAAGTPTAGYDMCAPVRQAAGTPTAGYDMGMPAQPASAPMAAPMQAAPAPAPQQQRGLLGGFFGPEGRDARARLAIALEGMTLNPNQALIGQLQQGIESRETAAQKNATAEWLRSRGRDDLAAAMEGGLPAADALRIAMQPADPMAELDLKIKQIELERLRNPQNEIREVNGRIISISPDNTVTELYGSAPAGFRQVTGAELGLTGADAQKLFNVSPENQITAIGGAGTTVNVDAGTGGKFEETFAKSDAERLAMVEDTGLAAIRNVARIDRLDQLLQTAPQGMEGNLKAFAGEFGVATEGLNDIQAAQGLINALVPEQRAPGSGPMSDADLALFKQSLPRIINQPGGNRAIVQTMRAIAQYDAQGAEIVQRLRNQEIDRTEAFNLLKSRPDPLAGMRNQMGDGAGVSQTGAGTVRTYNPKTGRLE